MKKGRINIVLVAAVVIICLCSDALLMVNYHYREQKLQGMKNPMDIANEYMQFKYGGHWIRLDSVFYAGKNDREGTYVVGRDMENVGSSYFSKNIKESWAILCETVIEIDSDGIIQISTIYNNPTDDIWVAANVYNETNGYWEDKWFTLKYENGKYVLSSTNLEEVVRMSIEDIVEIAEKQQEECENMLYEMKETELKRNKVVLLLGLLLINGTGIWLIIWKGLKRQKKDGYITETETVPEDEIQYLKEQQE